MTPTNNCGYYLKAGILFCCFLFISGCTARFADLTLVSTKNIDLSNTKFNIKDGRRVTGEDCKMIFLGIPLGYPTLQEAVDDALEKGGGNLMIDQVSYVKGFSLIIVGQTCILAEGTVINVNEKD